MSRSGTACRQQRVRVQEPRGWGPKRPRGAPLVTSCPRRHVMSVWTTALHKVTGVELHGGGSPDYSIHVRCCEVYATLQVQPCLATEQRYQHAERAQLRPSRLRRDLTTQQSMCSSSLWWEFQGTIKHPCRGAEDLARSGRLASSWPKDSSLVEPITCTGSRTGHIMASDPCQTLA